MSKRKQREPGRNWTIWRRDVAGHPFALFGWSKHRGTIRGLVLRAGPLGHLQGQIHSNRRQHGRRAYRQLQLSAWGIRGRRGKKFLRFEVAWTTRSKPRELHQYVPPSVVTVMTPGPPKRPRFRLPSDARPRSFRLLPDLVGDEKAWLVEWDPVPFTEDEQRDILRAGRRLDVDLRGWLEGERPDGDTAA